MSTDTTELVNINDDEFHLNDDAEMHKHWQDIVREIKMMNSNEQQRKEKQLATTKDKLKFAKVYNDLIHSGTFTEEVIKLELSYQPAVDEMLNTRDTSVAELQARSSVEIESAISQLGQTHTEETISSLSSRHCQDMERLSNNWNMSIEALKDAQQEEYYEKLQTLWNDYQKLDETKLKDAKARSSQKESITKSLNKSLLRKPFKESSLNGGDELNHKQCVPPVHEIMEESFTINLGSQLRTTHNLRLLAADTLHLCDIQRYHMNQARTQTAMSLYSQNLSAIVMLVDNQFKSYYGIQHEFSQMCYRFNEFHFDSFNNQIKHIRDKVMPAYAGRRHLETGDCYVTKHSNLANAHIVFHLVTNDSLKNGQVNSRHQIMGSLRNILRVAHMHDIKTISIPLLLVDEMDEEILTVNWCLKRAELVLKCVKGFLIEMASLSTGVEQGTIQFLVPRGISKDLFSSLSTLIPEVFRLSSSLNLKSQER